MRSSLGCQDAHLQAWSQLPQLDTWAPPVAVALGAACPDCQGSPPGLARPARCPRGAHAPGAPVGTRTLPAPRATRRARRGCGSEVAHRWTCPHGRSASRRASRGGLLSYKPISMSFHAVKERPKSLGSPHCRYDITQVIFCNPSTLRGGAESLSTCSVESLEPSGLEPPMLSGRLFFNSTQRFRCVSLPCKAALKVPQSSSLSQSSSGFVPLLSHFGVPRASRRPTSA